MRDWHAYAQERLGWLRETKVGEEEVVRELAGHLEECYAALCAKGIPEEEAYLRTSAEVENWQELRDKIAAARQEGRMQNRVMQLWVPGLVTFLGASGLLAILGVTGVRPLVFHAGDPSAIVLYVPWLVGLPIFGAFGAFLAHRAKAPSSAIHLSSAFPALIMAAVMLLILIGALFLDRPISLQMKTIGFWAAGLNWIILPGVALLSGDLVVQWAMKRGAQPN